MSDETSNNDQAQEPYRTPAEVSETPTKQGLLFSRTFWGALIAAIAIGGGAYAMLAPTTKHVEEFGWSRGPAPKFENSVVEYGEVTRSGQPPEEHPEVEDYEK